MERGQGGEGGIKNKKRERAGNVEGAYSSHSAARRDPPSGAASYILSLVLLLAAAVDGGRICRFLDALCVSIVITNGGGE
jgi:hypothetical protein